jgi:hypothetical protein
MSENKASRTASIGPATGVVDCVRCGSTYLERFEGEVSIHLAGLEDLDKSPTWLFPKMVVCLNCGAAHFVVPRPELRVLVKFSERSECSQGAE